MKLFISSTIALAAVAVAPSQAALPASVQALIDPTVDPCTDFYQYSCGNWIKKNPLGPTESSNDYSFSSVSKRNEAVIAQIVNEDWPLIGEFWDSCMDQGSRDAVGAKPLQTYLNRISSTTSKSDLLRLAGELSRTGAQFVSSVQIAGDYKDAKNNVIYLSFANFVLPNLNTYFDDKSFAAIEPDYRKYISSVMKLSGFNANGPAQQGQQGGAAAATNATYFEDAVISVEKKLAGVLLNVQGQTGDDAYYNPVKLGDAMAKNPLSIGAYLTGLGVLDKTKLTKDSKIIIRYPDYHDLVDAALAAIDIKDLRTYLAFTYVSNRARYLSDAFYEAYFQLFFKKLNGQPARSEPASICSSRLTTLFPDLIGKYYFMKMFDKEREDNTQLMTKLVEEAMGEHIAKLDWLDNATRIEAAGKLAKVANLIGQSKVKQSYPFTLKRDEFFNNVQSIFVNNYENNMKKIGNPVNRDLWSMSAAEVNAYYSPLENKMVFPAAILQAPFFNGSAHPAQNFGSIGAVIGHELTHGFDSSGRQYDGDGNKRNWWTATTGKEFDTRAKCMSDQYSTFIVNGKDGKPLARVNGVKTIGENIADNGGFGLTWDAYHKYASTPGFDSKGLTPQEADQTLFLAFAQTWCGSKTDGAYLSQVATDVHSPGQWRANGVAMNNENFAKTFNCKAPAPMNPTTKCKLW